MIKMDFYKKLKNFIESIAISLIEMVKVRIVHDTPFVYAGVAELADALDLYKVSERVQCPSKKH